jgi:hypothetical protein
MGVIGMTPPIGSEPGIWAASKYAGQTLASAIVISDCI